MTTLPSPKMAPPANPSAPQDLWQPYHQSGDSGIENALVEQYLPLVRTVVGRLAMTLPAHVSAEDLHSAGLVGLLQAIRSFSPSGGASFETFARFRIRGAVLDELRRLDWVPRLVHDKARKIQQALGELEQQLGEPPSEEQMAKALGLTPDEYRDWLEEIRRSPLSVWTRRRAGRLRKGRPSTRAYPTTARRIRSKRPRAGS